MGLGILGGLSDFLNALYQFYSEIMPLDLTAIVDSLIGVMMLLAVWRIVS